MSLPATMMPCCGTNTAAACAWMTFSCPRKPATIFSASSALWAGYMMAVGLLLGPLTGGDPLRGLVAGIAMGALMAGAFALVDRPAPAP